MSGRDTREVRVPLSFLPAGTFRAIVFQDDPAAEHGYARTEREVSPADVLDLALASAGGAIVRLVPAPGSPPRWRLAWSGESETRDPEAWQKSRRPACQPACPAAGALGGACAIDGETGHVLDNPTTTRCALADGGRHRHRAVPGRAAHRHVERVSLGSARLRRAAILRVRAANGDRRQARHLRRRVPARLPASGFSTSCGSTSTTCTTP